MIYEVMNKLGYSKVEIELIRNEHSLVNYREEKLCSKVKEIFQFLLDVGYMNQEIIKMTKVFPSIYSYSVQNMESKIEGMIDIGYTKEEIIKMTKLLPQIFGFSIDSMINKIEDFMSIGYTKKDIIKMTKSYPALYNYKFKENILVKVEEMLKLGCSLEEVIEIGRNYPSIYSYKIDNLTVNDRIDFIIKLGYTREEVIHIIKLFPQILGFSVKGLEEKIRYYDSIGLHDLVIINPVRLMQGIDLSYARYEFFKEKGIVVNIDNFNKLFKGSKDFQKKYGISKEDLLERYNYQEYLEQQNKFRAI